MRKIAIIILSISLNMCFGCSKEPSHRDGSFEYPQHMFLLRNKKNNFQLRTLICGLALTLMMFEHEADRPSDQHYPRDPASVNAMIQTCVIVILAYFTLFQPNLH